MQNTRTKAATVLALVFLVLEAAPVPSLDEIIELPGGRFAAGYVEDDGTALLIAGSTDGFDSEFIRIPPGWPSAARRFPGIDLSFMERLIGERLLLGSVRGSNLRGGYGLRVYQIVRATPDGSFELEWEWRGDGYGAWRENSPRFSPDGRLFGDMSTLRFAGEVRGRILHLGFAPSSEFRVVAPMAFPEADDYEREFGPPFLFLESDGPLVLAPYQEGAYIVRFDGAAARESRYLANEHATEGARRHYVNERMFKEHTQFSRLRWQPNQRILWCRGASTPWFAYDLSDLDLSAEEPIRPFLTLEMEGQPHPERGFIVTEDRTADYRLQHLWFDPVEGMRRVAQFDLGPRGITQLTRSAWITGSSALGDRSVMVSPNGLHALVVEERWGWEDERNRTSKYLEKKAEGRYYARRLELEPVED